MQANDAVSLDLLIDGSALETKLRLLEDNGAHLARLQCFCNLAGSIVLDLRQPLSVIAMDSGTNARLIAQAAPDLEKIGFLLDRIADSAMRADGAIGRVNAVVSRRKPFCTDLMVSQVVESAVSLTRYDCMTRGVDLVVLQNEHDAVVYGDQVHLQQVIVGELLDAAADLQRANRHQRLEVRQLAQDTRISLSIVATDGGHNEQRFRNLATLSGRSRHRDCATIRHQIIEAHGGRTIRGSESDEFIVELQLPRAKTRPTDLRRT